MVLCKTELVDPLTENAAERVSSADAATIVCQRFAEHEDNGRLLPSALLTPQSSLELEHAATESTLTLPNGVVMPLLGMGATHGGGYSHEAMVFALRHAGYRMIDTAKRYGTESLIAAAIADAGVPRAQLFLCSKLWPMDFGYERTIDACRASCRRLNTDYLGECSRFDWQIV